MNIRVCICSAAVLSLFLTGCHSRNDKEDQRFTWSSDAPLTIPYRVRIQKADRGNLLRNHSFETGKTFNLNSNKTSFVLDGWQQLGSHVEWVDIRNDSTYDVNEACSGYRAIKVTRNTAYETDEQGEGVISEFVKVIPGNYKLSLYVRLENALPQKARMGTRMFDGVDIRLQFFDRNKMPVKSHISYPFAQQVIDASFKGLSFANFKEIKSFNWGKIIGKSAYFPFQEGDIPSSSHYVKVFIGLKGRGTLWIDSISFTYTGKNFSLTERMQQYTDTAYTTPLTLIPAPKKMKRMESVVYFKPGMDAGMLPVIIVPDDAGDLVLDAARLIQENFRQGILKSNSGNKEIPVIRILRAGSAVNYDGAKLIISIGNTPLMSKYEGFSPFREIENHHQGYFIYSPADKPKLVLLNARNETGLYYAALSLVQLIDNNSPVFHNSGIVDYPDFSLRFCAMPKATDPQNSSQQGDLINELIGYKLNGIFSESTDGKTNGLSQVVNTTGFSDAKKSMVSILQLSEMLTPDDSTLTYTYSLRTTPDDVSSGADAIIVNHSVAGRMNKNLVVPGLFHNEMLDNSIDYKQCSGKDDVSYLYSGSSYFSTFTDAADIERYLHCRGGRPVFLDNSLLISSEQGHYNGSYPWYPGKIRLYNIFEPFGNEDMRDYFSRLDTTIYLLNYPPKSEVDIIRIATAADFMWNAKSYSKEGSLWRVLMTRYGPVNARMLLNYADKYGLVLEVLLRLEQKHSIARNYKSGLQLLADLTSLVGSLGESLGSQHRLVKELQQLNAGLKIKLSNYNL
ncbi:MAG: hypothetical protein JXA72_02435 [Bacteroidales bacterium]|nr:hypothetical protein [Bacteroidales bacterium]